MGFGPSQKCLLPSRIWTEGFFFSQSISRFRSAYFGAMPKLINDRPILIYEKVWQIRTNSDKTLRIASDNSDIDTLGKDCQE